MLKTFPLFLLIAFNVFAQSATTPADPDQPAPGTISGMVINVATGAPIADADVSTSINKKRVETKTDSSGRYTLRGVAPGAGQVTASTPAPDPFQASRASRPVTLAAGQNLKSIDVRIRPSATITGKVIDENKEPVPNMRVFLIAREYSWGTLRYLYASGGSTDDQGQYKIQRVEPGRGYLLMVQTPFGRLDAISDSPTEPRMRKRVAPATFYPGVPQIEAASLLVLRPGEVREGVDMAIARVPSLCIEGKALAGAAPSALDFDVAPQTPTSGASGNGAMFVGAPGGKTGLDGAFRICNLAPGAWRITVRQSPANYQQEYPPFYGSELVSLADKDVTNAIVSARPRIPVTGDVVWEGAPPNEPVDSKITIAVRPMTRAPYGAEKLSATASLPGSFSFEGLMMDEYATTVNGLSGGTYVKDLTYAGRSILREPLRAGSEAGDAGLRVTVARDGGYIQTKVTDKDNNPVADSWVTIIPATAPSEAIIAASYVSGETDQTGSWKSGTLAPGKYYVLATSLPADKTPETIAKIMVARRRSDPVEVNPNGAVTATVIQKDLE